MNIIGFPASSEYLCAGNAPARSAINSPAVFHKLVAVLNQMFWDFADNTDHYGRRWFRRCNTNNQFSFDFANHHVKHHLPHAPAANGRELKRLSVPDNICTSEFDK